MHVFPCEYSREHSSKPRHQVSKESNTKLCLLPGTPHKQRARAALGHLLWQPQETSLHSNMSVMRGPLFRERERERERERGGREEEGHRRNAQIDKSKLWLVNEYVCVHQCVRECVCLNARVCVCVCAE